MKILHVVAPARYGGLERVVQGLAAGQVVAAHAVEVLVILDREEPDHPFLRELRRDGVPYHPVVIPGRRYHRERAAVAEACRRLDAEVVHTHGYRPDVVDSGVARRLGLATVTTVHGFTGGGWKNRLYEGLQNRAFRRFDAVVCVSAAQLAALAGRGIETSHLKLIPNAWAGPEPVSRAEARRVLGLADDRPWVGWVGRLTREKGADLLVECLSELADVRLGVSVIGDGPERQRLQRRATELNLEAALRWHGAVSDAGRLMSAFDVVVLSSRTEGSPIALLEAMAASVPIVAAEVGGVPDMVSGAEALLVPPEDPKALAAALRRSLSEPAASKARGQAARLRLDREFRREAWVSRYQDVYESIARARGVRRPVR
jgi:glycosyltransferase involved in cell wall biosynthesis